MSSVRRNTRSKPSSSKAGITTDPDSRPSEKKTASKHKPSDDKTVPVNRFSSSQEMDTSLSEVKVQSSMSVDDFVVGCGEGVWSNYKVLCQRLPGRRSQVELLLTLCGEVRKKINFIITYNFLPTAVISDPLSPLSLWQHWNGEDPDN